MRILVTGAAGYIAPFVVKHLRERGHDVTPTDVRGVKDHYNVDLTERCEVLELLNDVRPDVICHLAAIGNVAEAAKGPRVAVNAGPYLTATLLDAVVEVNPIVRFIYTSTWEVYGKPRYQPLDEAHPTDPDHPYSIAKLAGERLALWYGRAHGIPVTALRLGSAHGPGMRANSVFSRFIDAGRKGQPLTVSGDGSQFRQWTHVRDIARAFELAALTPGIEGEVYNIVSPEATSIRELAMRVADRFGVGYTCGEPRPGDAPSAMVSGEKAKAGLGWEARVRFEDGLFELLTEEPHG